MRITPVSADVNVSADYPARGIPAAAFQSGAGAAGIEIARGAEDIGRLYAQKANQDAQAEGIYLQSQAELALQNSDAALRAVETDGPKYLEARRKQFQDVVQQVGGTAKNPGAQRVFNAHMQRSLVTMNGHALNYAADLTTKAEVAQLSTTVENYRTMLNGIDPLDTEAITAIQGKIDAAIMLREGTLGKDKATALTIEARHKTLEQVATRHETVDPAGFLQSVGRYQQMDGKTLDKLQVSAATRIDAAEKTTWESSDRFYKEQMAQIEEDRKQHLVFLDELARDGKLTTEHLRIARNTRTFKTTEEYDHLATLINTPPDRPSNQDVLRVVGADVRSLNPRTRDVDIRKLMSDGSLSIKDGMPLIDRLREHGQRLEDQDHTRRGEQYTAAMKEGERSLGMTGPFETLDPQSKQLIDQFTKDMNARSDWLNDRGEPSRKILYEMMPIYLSAQKKDVRLRFETQMGLMPKDIVGLPPAPEPGRQAEEVWQAWYSSAAQKVEALKAKNPELYQRTQLQLQELRDARKRMIDNAVRTEEFRSGPGGGSTGRTPVNR